MLNEAHTYVFRFSIVCFFSLISSVLFAQTAGVGIGTSNPQATLHVVGDLVFEPDASIVPTRLVGISATGDLTHLQLSEELNIVDGELQVIEDSTDDNILFVGEVDQSADAATTVIYNNYDIGIDSYNNENAVLRITGESNGYNMTGFANGYDGRIFYLYNAQGNNVTFFNLNANSSPENQIITGSGSNEGINGEGVAEFIYDGVQEKWILVNIRS